MGPREHVEKDDLARILVGLEPLPHERLQLLGQPLVRRCRDHERMRLDETVLPHDADHGDLLHRGVLQQTVLDFLRREPLARHLEQVVGPTAVGEVAVGGATHHVAGHVPLSPEPLLGLIHLLPIADRARVAAHPQRTHLAVGQLPTLVVAYPDVEARNDRTERSGPHCPGRFEMKMCHISAVPRPSNSSTPNVRFQRWYSSTGSGSPADVASRMHERSCLAAAEWLTIWLIIVGTLIMTVGRKRAIFPNSTSGVAASGNNTVRAPTENGNKRFEPVA